MSAAPGGGANRDDRTDLLFCIRVRATDVSCSIRGMQATAKHLTKLRSAFDVSVGPSLDEQFGVFYYDPENPEIFRMTMDERLMHEALKKLARRFDDRTLGRV